FAAYMRQSLLQPLGMTRSAFEPAPELAKDLAKGLMWTYHGREFPAPTFTLGMIPSGGLDAPVTDLGRFLSVLFAGGRGANGPVVSPETLRPMWTPQFAEPGAKSGFGLGFEVSEFEGRRRVDHSGAVHGHVAALAALPDDKL